MATDLPEKASSRWSWGTFFVALSALGTLSLAGAAFWQIRESRKAAELAYELARQKGLAENSPLLIIEDLSKGKFENVPEKGVRITNVGEGPAILLLVGLEYMGHEYEAPITDNKYLTTKAPSRVLEGAVFAVLEEEFAKQRELDPPFRRYYVQYADAFENEYRQYFLLVWGRNTSDKLEFIDKNSPKYKPISNPSG